MELRSARLIGIHVGGWILSQAKPFRCSEARPPGQTPTLGDVVDLEQSHSCAVALLRAKEMA